MEYRASPIHNCDMSPLIRIHNPSPPRESRRKNFFGFSAGEQAIDAAIAGKKPSAKAREWMREHGATTKKLKKSLRRSMQARNPRRPKELTRDEVAQRQDLAVAFTANVLGDEELADELDGLTVDEYADRRGLQLTNPAKNQGVKRMAKKQDVVSKLDELIQTIKERRPNPPAPTASPTVAPATGAPPAAVMSARKKASSDAPDDDERDDLVNTIAEIQEALDEGRVDRAQEIADDILDEYEEEEEESDD